MSVFKFMVPIMLDLSMFYIKKSVSGDFSCRVCNLNREQLLDTQ